MTNEELLIQSSQKVKEIKDSMEMLQLALAVEEECNLPFPNIEIFVGKKEGEPGICVNKLWSGEEEKLRIFFRDQLTHCKAKAKTNLLGAVGGSDTPPEPGFKEGDKATGKESNQLTGKKVAPAQQKRPTSADVVSDDKLRELYFIKGRKIKEIAEEYQVGAAGLYKRLEKMQKNIDETAKEGVRR